MVMRIGLESSILLNSGFGSAVYARNLMSILQTKWPDDEFFIYKFGSNLLNTPIRKRFESILRDTWWIQVALPLRAKQDRLDLLFCFTHSAPRKASCKVVVTILDIIPFLHPEWFYPWSWVAFYSKHFLPRVVRAATRIVTISEYSRQDISQSFKIPSEKIEVIPPGVDKRIFRKIDSSEQTRYLKDKYNLGRPFFLYVGSIEPRKNVDVIIKSYDLFRKNHRDEVELVIVGDWGWKYEPVRHALKNSHYSSGIKILGYVPTEDLPYLYNSAHCLIYPSSYEGYGVPIAEAMTCGCSVITTPVTSIPEVAGDAALYTGLGSVEELEHAMHRLYKDDALRQQCIRRGLERSESFSWEASAEKLHKLFEELGSN